MNHDLKKNNDLDQFYWHIESFEKCEKTSKYIRCTVRSNKYGTSRHKRDLNTIDIQFTPPSTRYINLHTH